MNQPAYPHNNPIRVPDTFDAPDLDLYRIRMMIPTGRSGNRHDAGILE